MTSAAVLVSLIGKYLLRLCDARFTGTVQISLFKGGICHIERKEKIEAADLQEITE